MNIDWGLVANVALSVVSITITIVVAPAFKLLMSMRDTLRDMNVKIGTTHPPAGILGDIADIKGRQFEHHDWLIRLGYGRRADDVK